MEESIGGYFGLETSNSNNIHSDSNFLKLNSGRNCLEYILRVRKYEKVYIPYFTCDAILEPFDKLNIKYEFYDVDDNLEPIFLFENIQENEGFLVNNYFGIKDQFISKIANKIPNLIIDNAQSLFSKPLQNIDTFYSPRKFVGVADGGLLSVNKYLQEDLPVDHSYNRMAHLLKRIDLSAEQGYQDFTFNDHLLANQAIKKMSHLTDSILGGINFNLIEEKRKKNFKYLHEKLGPKNELKLEDNYKSTPLVYPLRTKNQTLKEKLLKSKIYCATYWPNVLEWCSKGNNSYNLTTEIIALPLDQRYGLIELEKIVNIILLN